MQTYKAKIRLSGSLFNEVGRDGLTAPEITILRRLHGSDAVVEIKADAHVDRSEEAERARLSEIYASGLAAHKLSLELVLGPEGVPLARTVAGVDSLPPPVGEIKRGRPRKVDAEVQPTPAEPEAETTEPELEFN